MTLERLKPVSDALMRPLVAACLTIGVGPHALSLAGFAAAAAAAGAFVLAPSRTWLFLAAAGLVVTNGVFDLLDGAVAREQGTSSAAGDVLDHTLDRYADIVLVGGVAVATDELVLGFLAVTGVLMTSYLGTQAQAVDFGRLYAGFLGRADRLALTGAAAVAMAVYPDALWGFTVLGWLLVLFAVAGHLTAVQRFVVIWRGLD